MSTDGDLDRILRDAFEAKARSAVDDDRVAPGLGVRSVRPRNVAAPARKPIRSLAPLAAAVAVVLAVGLVLAIRTSTTTDGQPATVGSSHGAFAPHPTAAASKPSLPITTVHVMLKWSDGSQFGVGVPVIAYLSRKITDARPFARATTVTVNGSPVAGAWYFETSAAVAGYPLEAHYRLRDYWPAHAKVSVKLPVKGLSAGAGLAFDDSLTLDFSTGAANVATVDDLKHTLTLVSDGTTVGSYPVSLGARSTPTARGTKVIMEKGVSICMRGPGYYECGVKYTQRLTYGGEYLHAAPWNLANLGNTDTSNGCTNLSPADAAVLYRLLEIGDLVNYPNANGPAMKLAAGYGDWNVAWSTWLTGGAVATR
ncbi:MAG: L,D-transpeptidase [Actinomycetota bacterium]|nr:L,D-transpeptidase [Actinomycetota bacterium]